MPIFRPWRSPLLTWVLPVSISYVCYRSVPQVEAEVTPTGHNHAQRSPPMTMIAATARTAAVSPETSPEPASLLTPYHLGGLRLGNRMVLSPMTRSRAVAGNVPNPMAAQYYVQRASAGLQITEGTQVSPQGIGYIRTPGIHSAEQVAGWKRVTDAVHAAGGTIFAQLWHVGRVSHADFHGGE